MWSGRKPSGHAEEGGSSHELRHRVPVTAEQFARLAAKVDDLAAKTMGLDEARTGPTASSAGPSSPSTSHPVADNNLGRESLAQRIEQLEAQVKSNSKAIERLKADKTDRAENRYDKEKVERLHAKIERLSEQNAEFSKEKDASDAEKQRLRDEVKRLSELLANRGPPGLN